MTARWKVRGSPRKWQEEAFDGWVEQGCSGIAHVVTGAGKTRFAEMCIAHFMSGNPNGHVVILVPTVALLDQWYVDLSEDLGLEDEEIASYSGRAKPQSPRPVNVVVMNTGREVAPRLSAERPTLLIVDECHRAAPSQNARALRGEHQATLGLSATPHREYDRGLEEVLIPRLGPIFFSYDYADARRDGVITEFSLLNISVPLQPDEQKRYDSLTHRVGKAMRVVQAGEEDREKLKRLLRMRASVSGGALLRVPVSVNVAMKHRGRQMVIFHERIPAAEEIAEILGARGLTATIYHSKISDVVRRDNLRLFRRGAFQVLVSCRALDEGVNVPEAEVGIIASSTASSRQRIQRLGRVLRPARGKDRALVVTLYATAVERQRLETEAESLDAASEVKWQAAEIAGAATVR
jgi:superfamily II DNA or RNA helicase